MNSTSLPTQPLWSGGYHITPRGAAALNADNIWRIRNNMEIEGADIVRFIKAKRIKWLGHIQTMDQARPTRKLLDWKPMGTELDQ
jgi:hypothetical protein